MAAPVTALGTLKVKVGEALCHPAIGWTVARLYHNRIPNGPCVVDTSLTEVTAPSVASLFWGMYERHEIRFVRRYLRPDLDVVELGSSLGVVASHIARIQQPDRTLVCVEANPRLIESIRRNLALNAPGRRIAVEHAALDYSGAAEVTLAFHGDHLDSRVNGETGAPARRGTRVPATTLGALLDAHAIRGPYALVCDVEGSEAGLLLRDAAALARCQQIVIELHEARFDGRDLGEADLVSLIRELGFRTRDAHHRVFAFER